MFQFLLGAAARILAWKHLGRDTVSDTASTGKGALASLARL